MCALCSENCHLEEQCVAHTDTFGVVQVPDAEGQAFIWEQLHVIKERGGRVRVNMSQRSHRRRAKKKVDEPTTNHHTSYWY